MVTDSAGKPVDFGTGKTLKANKGIIATSTNVHAEVIKAVKEELEKPNL